MQVILLSLLLLHCIAEDSHKNGDSENCAGAECPKADDFGDDEASLIQTRLTTEYAATKPNGARTQRQTLPLSAARHTVAKPTPKPLIEGQKVKANVAGDLPAFLSAIKFNIGLVFVFVLLFMFLQRRYPKIYAYRAMSYFRLPNGQPGPDVAQTDRENPNGWDVEEPTWLQWIPRAWGSRAPTSQQVEYACGLDNAMLIEFTKFAMEIMIAIGVPACAIGIPIYAKAGGGFAKDDRLSWVGIGNVVYNGTDQHALSAADAEKLPQVQ